MQRAEGLRVGVVDVCQVEAEAKEAWKKKKSNLKKSERHYQTSS